MQRWLFSLIILAAPLAQAADSIKIGFVTTLTTPDAVIGQDMVDAANLALADIGGTMAGKPVELIVEDDNFKPEIGKQKTDKLIKQDNVDFVTGFIWSHVLLASSKSVFDADKFLISANAGSSRLAGKHCHENFFSVSWQNDQTPMAMGEVLNQRGVKKLYAMAPNYAAGKDMIAGLERTFKGEIVGRDMTKWGADAQLDFSAELAKVKASDAEGLFIFYPGKAGGAFIRQYEQAGLAEQVPLYTVFTIDSLSLPRLQEAGIQGALGSFNTLFWSPDLDTPQNQQFVTNFREKYGRYPSFYAAQSYDAIYLIKSAVEAVMGDVSQTDAVRAALLQGDFPSVRGDFTFGKNHFPVQNFYLREVVADEDANWTTKIIDTVLENHQDPFAIECPL